jgi:hypothetical protein
VNKERPPLVPSDGDERQRLRLRPLPPPYGFLLLISHGNSTHRPAIKAWSLVNAVTSPNPINGTVFSNGAVSFPQWIGTAPGFSSFCPYPKDDIVTRDVKRGSLTPGSQYSTEPRGGLL